MINKRLKFSSLYKYRNMSTINNYRNNRIQNFNDKFKHSCSLEENWNLKNYSSEKLNFDFTIKENYIYFNFNFQKKYPFYDFSQLPLDINRYIYSYYHADFITIKTKIHFPNEYPFKAPIWYLLKVEHNLELPICLSWYYTNIIDNHNNIYKRDWTPAIDIEKDLLDFLQKISHFNYILECQ